MRPGVGVAAVAGGGSGTDTSFGLAVNASGAIAIAGVYNGPNANSPSILTTFGATTLSTIGKADIFVATLSEGGGSTSLSPPDPPALEAASDSSTRATPTGSPTLRPRHSTSPATRVA